jgi:hypothetical protein
MKRPTSSPRASKQPVWSLYKDGLTRSLIARWMVCLERFRLYTVDGLVEDRGWDNSIGYGDMFHAACEANGKGLDWQKAIRQEASKQVTDCPNERQAISLYADVCALQFAAYLRHWQKIDSKKVWIATEEEFVFLYELPDGRAIPIRGKRDGIFTAKRNGKKATILQENKTRGKIDEQGTMTSLDLDLQTLIYLLGCEAEGTHIDEVLYNVIRRPMASGERQKKGESDIEFRQRVAVYKGDPEQTFYRWSYAVGTKDLEAFRQKVMTPLLTTIANWWDSIAADPFNPWGSPLHYIRPFGVYDPLANGLGGSYFFYVSTGSKAGLKTVNTVFPELDHGNNAKKQEGDKGKSHSKEDIAKIFETRNQAKHGTDKSKQRKQPVRRSVKQ